MSEQESTGAQDIRWLAEKINFATGTKTPVDAHIWQQISSLTAGDASHASRLTAVKMLLQGGALQNALALSSLRPIDLPAIAVFSDGNVVFVREYSKDKEWVVEDRRGQRKLLFWPPNTCFYAIEPTQHSGKSNSARVFFRSVLERRSAWMYQVSLASIFASIVALATSLYSMQIYDRVIGQGGVATLHVLTGGVVIAIVIEFLIKIARSSILDKAVEEIDLECAQGVFSRLLTIRADQFPRSVGTLAAQVRGFETIRGFHTSLRTYLTTDAPFAVFFLLIIFMIGGPVMAAIPAVSLAVAFLVGYSFKQAIQKHSARMDLVGNRRQGFLVEIIQAIEVIKATGSAWIAQGKWNHLSRQSSQESVEVKHLNDMAGYLSALIQQLSYVGMVAAGAYVATTTQTITSGAIIACSIISGRVLTPINQIPSLLVQWAHYKVAMDNLEKLFSLEDDCPPETQTLQPEFIAGKYQLACVEFKFPSGGEPLSLPRLEIAPGERVAILGNIGAGKSTLLKLLSGMYKPTSGQVLLDGLDIQQIAIPSRASAIAHLPQNTRLVSGTLRENLCLGNRQHSDQDILKVATATGLSKVLAGRSEGLDLRIAEGGEGLSGGQKQLVALTRVILSAPRIWLLDEPTAAFDDTTELQAVRALRAAIEPDHTLVLVTHKLKLLELVDRIIVLTPKGIAVDGPRNAVLEHLRGQTPPPASTRLVGTPAPTSHLQAA